LFDFRFGVLSLTGLKLLISVQKSASKSLSFAFLVSNHAGITILPRYCSFDNHTSEK
jgi:hypothetical protein